MKIARTSPNLKGAGGEIPEKKLTEIIKFTWLRVIGFLIQVSAISFQSSTFSVEKASPPANVSMLTINTLFAPRRKDDY